MALAMAIVIAGCDGQGPKLAQIYDRAAKHHDAQRNPVIVIPGIMGSKLIDTETQAIVWGAFSGQYANPQTTKGVRLLSLPMRRGAVLADLQDGVVPDGALDRVNISLLGLPISLRAYRDILLTLGVGGYRDELFGESGSVDYGDDHYTCFQFDYDWRRDNVENARRLHDFVLQKRAYVAAEIENRYGVANAEVKFDIVAHSMGGLVTRYFLRYGETGLPDGDQAPQPTWAGAKYVDKVILVGTPNAGSINALQFLIEGRRFAPFIPRYPAAALGTMPSIYQLLPRPRHRPVVDESGNPVDFLDAEVWKRNRWGLADPNSDQVLKRLLPDVESQDARRAIAQEHLAKSLKRARRFFAALDAPAIAPPGVEFHLFAGDAMATSAGGVVDSETGLFWINAYAPGDETVTRASALMDERRDDDWSPKLRSPIKWDSVRFLFKSHLGMTSDAGFSDNVLFLLLE